MSLNVCGHFILQFRIYDFFVKTTCFLANIDDFQAFNEVYAKYFTTKPARSCVAVKQLPKNVLCEVEVIGYLG